MEDDTRKLNYTGLPARRGCKDLSRTVEIILEKIRQNCTLSPFRCLCCLLPYTNDRPCLRHKINWPRQLTRRYFDYSPSPQHPPDRKCQNRSASMRTDAVNSRICWFTQFRKKSSLERIHPPNPSRIYLNKDTRIVDNRGNNFVR